MSHPDFRKRVATRFDAAAARYDAHSGVQQRAAAHLAGLIATAPLPPRPRVLEIGCGTGHLTQRLTWHLPGAIIFATDIAPAMLAACRERLCEDRRVAFAAMDGTQPAVAGSFDLICANLAIQWFENLPAVLATYTRLLAPGGMLAVSLLGTRTFREWQDAHARRGLVAGTLAMPTTQQCRAAFPADGRLQLTTEIRIDQPPTALDFLRSLRAIGADTPTPGHTPLSATRLRRVLSELGKSPTITYELMYARWQRREEPPIPEAPRTT